MGATPNFGAALAPRNGLFRALLAAGAAPGQTSGDYGQAQALPSAAALGAAPTPVLVPDAVIPRAPQPAAPAGAQAPAPTPPGAGAGSARTPNWALAAAMNATGSPSGLALPAAPADQTPQPYDGRAALRANLATVPVAGPATQAPAAPQGLDGTRFEMPAAPVPSAAETRDRAELAAMDRPLTFKQRLLRAAATMAPVALGGIFGGLTGAGGAAEGVAQQIQVGQQLAAQRRQQLMGQVAQEENNAQRGYATRVSAADAVARILSNANYRDLLLGSRENARAGALPTVDVQQPGGASEVVQWDPRTMRYDIPVGAAPFKPAGGGKLFTVPGQPGVQVGFVTQNGLVDGAGKPLPAGTVPYQAAPRATAKPIQGTSGGKPATAVYELGKGFLDAATLRPLPDFKMAPAEKTSFADVYGSVSGEREIGAATTDWKNKVGDLQSVMGAIDQAQNGSQLANSVLPMMGALMTTSAGGVHRINATEVSQFSSQMGSLARRINTSLDKAGAGALPPQTIQEMHQLAGMYRDVLYKQYVAQAQATATLFGVPPQNIALLSKDGSRSLRLPDAMADARGKLLTPAAVRQAAADHHLTYAQALKQAQAHGYRVLQP